MRYVLFYFFYLLFLTFGICFYFISFWPIDLIDSKRLWHFRLSVFPISVRPAYGMQSLIFCFFLLFHFAFGISIFSWFFLSALLCFLVFFYDFLSFCLSFSFFFPFLYEFTSLPKKELNIFVSLSGFVFKPRSSAWMLYRL